MYQYKFIDNGNQPVDIRVEDTQIDGYKVFEGGMPVDWTKYYYDSVNDAIALKGYLYTVGDKGVCTEAGRGAPCAGFIFSNNPVDLTKYSFINGEWVLDVERAANDLLISRQNTRDRINSILSDNLHAIAQDLALAQLLNDTAAIEECKARALRAKEIAAEQLKEVDSK